MRFQTGAAPDASEGTWANPRDLITLDRSGYPWIAAVPGAFLLLSAIESALGGWADDSELLISIDWGPPGLTTAQIIFVLLTITYLFYPTILGWALVTVPCAIFFFSGLGWALSSGGDDLILQVVVLLFCAALFYTRPKRAGTKLVKVSLFVAAVLEGWYFVPQIWNA
jgi:hypothetical protein